MNDLEKHKIFELRSKGIGYKSISKLLGLSRDAVRNYCKRHGLDGCRLQKYHRAIKIESMIVISVMLNTDLEL